MRSLGTGWTDGVGHLGAWGGVLLCGRVFLAASPLGWILLVTIPGALLPGFMVGIFGKRQHRRALGDPIHLVRPARLLHLGDERRIANRVADPQPSQPECLGHRARDEHARRTPQQVEIIARGKLCVRFVDDDHAIRLIDDRFDL